MENKRSSQWTGDGHKMVDENNERNKQQSCAFSATMRITDPRKWPKTVKNGQKWPKMAQNMWKMRFSAESGLTNVVRIGLNYLRAKYLRNQRKFFAG